MAAGTNWDELEVQPRKRRAPVVRYFSDSDAEDLPKRSRKNSSDEEFYPTERKSESHRSSSAKSGAVKESNAKRTGRGSKYGAEAAAAAHVRGKGSSKTTRFQQIVNPEDFQLDGGRYDGAKDGECFKASESAESFQDQIQRRPHQSQHTLPSQFEDSGITRSVAMPQAALSGGNKNAVDDERISFKNSIFQKEYSDGFESDGETHSDEPSKSTARRAFIGDDGEATNERERSSSSKIKMDWEESDVLAELENLNNWVAGNLIKLFEDDNTIPFIARYRKEMTGHMDPEQLRHVKETYDEIKAIEHKAASMLKSIEKLGKQTPEIRKSILSSKSLSELDMIYTPFKTGSKKTLAERARKLGLDHAAQEILNGSDHVSLSSFVDKYKEGLSNEKDVQLGIQHIIADIISKDRGVLDFISGMRKSANIRLESCRAKGVVSKELAKESKLDKTNMKKKPLSASEKEKVKAKADEESKYRNYFEFSMNVKYIKPHQVLAINRGESEKELTVRVNVPENILEKLQSFCHRQWLSKGLTYELRSKLFDDSIKDSYNRLIQPLIIRQVRSELNQRAERASLEVFAVNLKKLLLTPPFRGRVVLGIDPGFRHGCKVALVSQTGEVLEAGIITPTFGKRTWDLREDQDAQWMRRIMNKSRCEVIALGNGTACRETEEYLSDLIQNGFFRPHLDVSYAIVNEQGASIYSCSSEAKNEFPDLDPNLISAVSIARRLQDPLAELVKVEPQHLGVGMYQHDVPEKKLARTLDEIVVECVSFVGVDLNTSPLCLLRRVAGLNSSKAQKILDYRSKHGSFITREEIKKVKGIGEKSFEQCAGFIRINPETVKTGAEKCNRLDSTWIHPESYALANRFLEYCHVKLEDIGHSDSIRLISKAVASSGGLKGLAQKLDANEVLVKLISDGLQLPINHDLRSEFEKPLFRKGLTNIKELHSGDILTGRITNTTHFGAFVDIGVGRNGLIHNTRMSGQNPQLGDKVQVKVLDVEVSRQRIGLQLLAIL